MLTAIEIITLRVHIIYKISRVTVGDSITLYKILMAEAIIINICSKESHAL